MIRLIIQVRKTEIETDSSTQKNQIARAFGPRLNSHRARVHSSSELLRQSPSSVSESRLRRTFRGLLTSRTCSSRVPTVVGRPPRPRGPLGLVGARPTLTMAHSRSAIVIFVRWLRACSRRMNYLAIVSRGPKKRRRWAPGLSRKNTSYGLRLGLWTLGTFETCRALQRVFWFVLLLYA